VIALGPNMVASFGFDPLRGDADAATGLRWLPSSTYRTPKSRPTSFTSTARPLYVKQELRAMTNKDGYRYNAVITSSAIPSARKSCSGSLLMLTESSTAIDGLSGSGYAGAGLIDWAATGGELAR
jgi:hypothetical protein